MILMILQPLSTYPQFWYMLAGLKMHKLILSKESSTALMIIEPTTIFLPFSAKLKNGTKLSNKSGVHYPQLNCSVSFLNGQNKTWRILKKWNNCGSKTKGPISSRLFFTRKTIIYRRPSRRLLNVLVIVDRMQDCWRFGHLYIKNWIWYNRLTMML